MSVAIKNGKVVDLKYVLKNSEGEILDESDAKDPFTYLHGAQQIVPGLENALQGLKVGDKKEVTVAPADGYGEMNPGLKMIVKRAQFPNGVDLEEGMSFEASGGDGMAMVFTIESIQGDDIHVDGNHPLAGETLYFSVEVLKIRDASEEEIEHGHAHGPHGHGHGHDHDHDHDHDCDHDHGDSDDDGHGHLH